MLTSAGLHDPDDPLVQLKLPDLHPTVSRIVAPLPIRWERKGPWGASDVEAMRTLLQSFPPGGAAGPSGLRPLHLLNCIRNADSAPAHSLLSALLSLVTCAAMGGLDPHTVQTLCIAKLVPLKKKDGGVRPIALSEKLRRVIAKWLVRSTAAVGLAHSLAPLQKAFAKNGPCDVASICYATAAK